MNDTKKNVDDYERGKADERARCVAKIRANVAELREMMRVVALSDVSKWADRIERGDHWPAAESGAKDGPEKTGANSPVCSTCNDTRKMPWRDGSRVMCTSCPRPCERCVTSPVVPYCASTPCACSCHAPKPEKTGANLKCPRCEGLGILSFGHGTDDEICSSCYVRRDALPAPKPEKPRRAAKYWVIRLSDGRYHARENGYLVWSPDKRLAIRFSSLSSAQSDLEWLCANEIARIVRVVRK